MKHTDIDLDRNEFNDFISKKGMKGLMKGISKHLVEDMAKCKKEYKDTTNMLKASKMMARRQSPKDAMKSCMEAKQKARKAGMKEIKQNWLKSKKGKPDASSDDTPDVLVEEKDVIVETPITPPAPPTPPAARQKPTNQYVLYAAIGVVGFLIVRKYMKK